MTADNHSRQARTTRPVLRVLAVLALVICLAILGSLGTWQASKYLLKRHTFALMDERLTLPVVPVSSASDLVEELDYRRVQLRDGALDNERSVLVSRRFHKNQPGFFVATPYVFEDDSTVLVQRGWVPEKDGEDLASSAPLPPPDSLVGLVYTPRDPRPDDLARESRAAGEFEPGGWQALGELDADLLYDALPHAPPPRTNTLVILGEDFAQNWDQLPEPTHDYITDPYLTPAVHFGYATLWYGSALLLIWLFWAGWTGRLDPGARH